MFSLLIAPTDHLLGEEGPAAMLPNMVSSAFPCGGGVPPRHVMTRDMLRPVFDQAHQHVPRYTGYVPGLKNTFGLTYGSASATMLNASQNREEPVQISYSPNSMLRKLQCNKGILGGSVPPAPSLC